MHSGRAGALEVTGHPPARTQLSGLKSCGRERVWMPVLSDKPAAQGRHVEAEEGSGVALGPLPLLKNCQQHCRSRNFLARLKVSFLTKLKHSGGWICLVKQTWGGARMPYPHSPKQPPRVGPQLGPHGPLVD